MISGVYRIRNLVNNKGYVGSAISFRHRWATHEWLLCSDQLQHHSPYLQHSWDKYGEENFVYEILELCEPTKEKLLALEQIWMDSLCSYLPEYGYNVCRIAGNCLGVKHSEETREARRGEKSRFAKLTWKKVREIREKYLLGSYTCKVLAEEYGVKKSCVRFIINNVSWKDKTLGEEYHKKVSEVKRGNLSSEKRKKKISKALKGIKRSKETKKKMSIVQRGENGYWAKLTWAKVREIREKYLTGKFSYSDLAKEFEMKRASIEGIVKNRRWQDEALHEEYLKTVFEIAKNHLSSRKRERVNV